MEGIQTKTRLQKKNSSNQLKTALALALGCQETAQLLKMAKNVSDSSGSGSRGQGSPKYGYSATS